jgi:hypothetical protein
VQLLEHWQHPSCLKTSRENATEGSRGLKFYHKELTIKV